MAPVAPMGIDMGNQNPATGKAPKPRAPKATKPAKAGRKPRGGSKKR
jgi:hypothetical protein